MVGILSSDQIRPPTRPWCTCQTLITSPNLTINQYCRHAPRDPSSPQFPKDWLSQFPPLWYFTTPTQKSFQISLVFGRWRRPSAMASSDKIWHYEQVGFLPGKISCQERFPGHFVGRRWKSRTQNTPRSAESVGIATSTYQRWHHFNNENNTRLRKDII